MWHRVGIAALAGLIGSIATDAAHARSTTPAQSLLIACDQQQTLRVAIRNDTAVVTTALGRYALARRASSIGVRYGSSDAAFALDEDRAVFITANDGPYKNCRTIQRIASGRTYGR